MRTLKLTLAYDGTDYAGWQVQNARRQTSPARRELLPGRADVRHQKKTQKPTVQGTVEGALSRILQEQVKIVGSGRTDAGVHALAQVAHCRIRSPMPCERVQRALNSVLPSDIVVTHLEEVRSDFHARFDAKWKRYRYQLVTGPVVLPFERRYVHQVRVPLNVALMRREAAALRGRHDMRAFHQRSRLVRDARRTIRDIRLIRRGDRLTIEIEANGFLHTMMRGIVGTLLDVGRGHRPPGTIARILKTRDRRLLGPTAPARGLSLLSVTY